MLPIVLYVVPMLGVVYIPYDYMDIRRINIRPTTMRMKIKIIIIEIE